MVVLPMPGSPVTNTILRSPASARSHHLCSHANSTSRPTKCLVGEARCGAECEFVSHRVERATRTGLVDTGAINR
jgi:hypothetical protein